ncbi:MAG: peptidase T [Treponema sp.]|jgi:tripeptide aminopeptidase|nr:peptidase T [Treponema sp.]
MNSTVNEAENEFCKLTTPRFLKYARFLTTSDRHKSDTPSTTGQWDLAKALIDELRGMGLKETTLTDHCYVIARIPASAGKEDRLPVGFLAHLDTSEEVSGEGVNPCLVESYGGKPIDLGSGLFLDPELDPGIAAHIGRALIHADGKTLLGADDKAGISVIMGAAEYLLSHPEIEHGPIELIFSPDEETGKGLPEFPIKKVQAKVCYTVDGGPLGELEWECFNAWAAEIKFTGISMHLGQARGRMVNAALMASVYAAMLPRNESPEATDGYFGYYCPLNIMGDVETTVLEVFIRDFDRKEGERRLAALETFARAVEAQFPGGKAEVTIKDQYHNMKEKIGARPEVVEKLRQAFINTGVEIIEKPIRGGTDGSRLTEMGIPTPNIFTGGRNFHSRKEWLSVPEMAASCRIIVELAKLWSEKER